MGPSFKRFAYTSLLAATVLSGTGVFASSKLKNGRESEQVDKIFVDLQKPGSPGCAVGVFRNGQTIYSRGYGLSSIELNAPITPQTVFDIGSSSKQFTATSILLLEQQGKLSVNDDVRKYIPELPDYAKSAGQPITILNLLNHTSGLRDYLSLLQLSGASFDSVTTDDDALALIVRQKKLNFPPGSDWVYSNTGYFLLSVIVKRVSGMTLREFASRNIFQPLKMTHTTFRDDHTMLIPNRALAYDPVESGGYKLDVSYFEQLGDGAVHTSVQDLAMWDENFYSAALGGNALLTSLQDRGKLSSGKVIDYAKGLFIEESRGLRTVRHGGSWGGYRAELLRFPNQHFSVACLCNVGNANPEKRADQVAEVYLGGLMKPAEAMSSLSDKSQPTTGVALTSSQMQGVAGMYRNPNTKEVARITMLNGKLQLQFLGSTFGLRAMSPTQLLPIDFPVNAKLSFEAPNGNTYRTMKISGSELFAATYQHVEPAVPSQTELTAYAGDFKSEELGSVYRLRIADSKLTLVRVADDSGFPHTGLPLPLALVPTVADEFEISSQGVTVHFVKNSKSEITGFELDEGRTRGIAFIRIEP